MRITSRVIQLLLACAIAALVAASLYTAVLITVHQQTWDQTRRYTTVYPAAQTVIELTRLEGALLRADEDRDGQAGDEARLRYEILLSRLQDMEGAEFAAFLAEDPGRMLTLERLRTELARLEPMIAAELDAPDYRGAAESLRSFEVPLLDISADAESYGADMAAGDRRALSRLHDRFSALTVGLVAAGLCLVGMLMWHNRLLERTHRRLREVTDHWRSAASELSLARSEAEQANGELRNQNTLFDTALNNMSQGLCMFGGDDLVPVVVNRQYERMFRLAGGSAQDEPGARTQAGLMTPDLAADMRAALRSGRAAAFERACSDGRVIEVAQRPMPAGGWVATFADVTEQRRAQARIEHMARHDGLTNLPNRYAFRERLHGAMADCRQNGRTLAIMCLDLDRFKEVNDTLGHPTGDALLCAVAERIKGCLRTTDMVARFGGDEFAILLPVADGEDAENLARRIVDEMSRPFEIAGEVVHATSSVGVAFSSACSDDPDQLLKYADLALYAAKDDGRRTYRFFEAEMGARLETRHAIARDLRQALADGDLTVHYQPVVELRTRRVTGLEALVRWTHPVRGVVPPGEFIPIAEETGLVAEVGRFVLGRACRDAMLWPDEVKIAVNLSAVQFTRSDVIADVADALRDSGISARRLVLEITELLLLANDRATFEKLHELKALGIEIAMDDFGTGYSSLSYLRKYPFDRMKVDRSFVHTAREGEQGAAIIRTIVDLGRSLGMTTVAEGIETEAELKLLLEAGCPEGQGYLFSRPVPRESVPALLVYPPTELSRVA